MIGLIIFLLPSFEAVGPKTMTGYALILLYMMTPMEVMLESHPPPGPRAVSFRKIDDAGPLAGRGRGPAPRLPGAPVPAPRMDWESLELRGVTHAYWREREDEAFPLGPIDLSFGRASWCSWWAATAAARPRSPRSCWASTPPRAARSGSTARRSNDEERDALPPAVSVVFRDFYLFDELMGMASPELDDAARRRTWGGCTCSTRCRCAGGKLSHHRPVHRPAQAAGAAEARTWKTGPSTCSTSGRRTRTPSSRTSSTPSSFPSCRRGGKTVIVISHDDRYYAAADRIVRLDNGAIEYDGSPKNFQYRPAGVPIASAQEA